MSNNVYGIVVDGIHHDASKSERGAKQFATRNGFSKVSVRYNCGMNVSVIAEKVNGRWVKVVSF